MRSSKKLVAFISLSLIQYKTFSSISTRRRSCEIYHWYLIPLRPVAQNVLAARVDD
jgi:hypothetical protein